MAQAWGENLKLVKLAHQNLNLHLYTESSVETVSDYNESYLLLTQCSVHVWCTQSNWMPVDRAFGAMMHNYSSISCSGGSSMQKYLHVWCHRFHNRRFWSLIKCWYNYNEEDILSFETWWFYDTKTSYMSKLKGKLSWPL